MVLSRLLLICTGLQLLIAQFNVTRLEESDTIFWSGTSINCTSFTNNTATWNGPSSCTCENALTFSTENNKCVSYANEGE